LPLGFDEWPNLAEYIDMCQRYGIKRVYITGQNTDPLVYDHFAGLVEFLKNLGFFVGIRTNGVLAVANMNAINKIDSVGYSVFTLDSKVQRAITKSDYIPHWDYIFNNTKIRQRASIVICEQNVGEVFGLLKFLSNYPLKYIQLRRISTDTRMDEMKPHIECFENLAKYIENNFKRVSEHEKAPIYDIYGKDVVLWRTVETTANSLNYFTDGTISEEYFIIEGYLKNFSKGKVLVTGGQ
jgi:molybdenum cofactor biosynthesis enzyme MoaA